MYTALLLDETSKSILIERFKNQIPAGWEIIAHHMTINLGSASAGPAATLLGKEFQIHVVSYAINDRVFALGVETEVPSVNAKKHITFAVNRAIGAKPKESNNLTGWTNLINPFFIKGVVVEV